MAKAFSSYGDLATAGWAWPPALMSVNGVVIVSASPEGSLNRRCSRSQPATPARANNTAASSGKRKHIQHPALRRGRRQVTHCIGPATVGARIARVEIACHHGAGPTANAGEDGDVLPAIRTAIRHRLADDSRGRLVAPE